ncbi:MAG: GyrI-like domain-containing protein [Pseudomonadota bacterium]
MAYEVTVETVSAAPIAAVRRQARAGQIGAVWKPALDQVWAFLRQHPGLWTDGHNLFLYHHAAARGDPMEIDFGVQVTRSFPHESEVRCVDTPAGEVAIALHVGGYDTLHLAHEAVHAWLAQSGRTSAGISWELYGDPSPDPAKTETRVYYLLARA